MKEKYAEIIKLHEYCVKIGVDCVLERFKDGYAIRFNNGWDVVQHYFSYGNDAGCVEPAIDSRLDYTAVPLKNAKALVKRHKDKLNKPQRSEGSKQKTEQRWSVPSGLSRGLPSVHLRGCRWRLSWLVQFLMRS